MHLHVYWYVFVCVYMYVCIYVFKYVYIVEREKDMGGIKELKKDWGLSSSDILRHMIFIPRFSRDGSGLAVNKRYHRGNFPSDFVV